MENKANINLYNKYHNTPLHVAALNNYIEICNYLLEHKADIMKKNYVILLFNSLYRNNKLL